ncbi:MAG: hypothetical protein D6714_21625 [Bacteroidetes bacterium]|nr:MAG: hypothetical protein D6714_21625 [Bacteroidota bacterium]
MKIANIYPKVILLALVFLAGSTSSFAQLELKIQLMEDSLWGVYVKPLSSITPTTNTITGSAQVTIVAPTGFNLTDAQITDVAGSWELNAPVVAPPENPTVDYYSIGFDTDNPQIVYKPGEETLLFTIARTGSCPDTLYLIDNTNDPFIPANSASPGCGPGTNSACNNPGNNIDVFDAGAGGAQYFYTGNYAPSAWSCHDCDGDGILNAFEDTNGNGTFDVGVDTSNLCDICDPIHPETAEMDFYGSSLICADDVADTAFLVVNIVGGWNPYTVTYTDGSNNYSVSNYESGDTIKVVPTVTDTFSLVTIQDSNGCVIDPDSLSGTAPITVEGPVSFTQQPSSVSVCSGESTYFASGASNAGDGTIIYTWQISTDNGATFTNLSNGTPYSGADTDSLVISDVAGLNANQYRLAISTSACDTTYSSAATLTVEGPITITTQPNDATICAGDNVTFTSGANNAGQGTLSMVWEISRDQGTTYVPVETDPSLYSGQTTAALSISSAPDTLDNYYYRLRISTPNCVNEYSDPAILRVEGPLAFTLQPVDQSACAGQAVQFPVAISNPGSGTLIYQWQVNDGSSGWQNLNNDAIYGGTKSDTLVITDVTGLDGYQYRVNVSTGACTQITSNTATLTIDGTLTWNNSVTRDTIVCSGSDAAFFVSATISQGSISWKWQRSSNGNTWIDLQNGGAYSGVNTSTLAISPALDSISGSYFRAVVMTSTGTCSDVGSKEVQLFVEGPLTVSADPADAVVCSGNAHTFSATISNPGYGDVSYQWEISLDGGNTFFALSNSSLYNGAFTDKLSISDVAGLSPVSGPAYQYRLKASTSTCSVIQTAAATLTVEGPVQVDDQPFDTTICDGSDTYFRANVSNLGAGTLSYQWQVTTDGISWANLSDGGIYSGTTTDSLILTSVPTGYNGRCYRLRITTGQCTGGDAFYSDPACLTVEGPISITTQPTDQVECSDDFVQFTVGTLNGGQGTISYQWEESTNNGSTWTTLTNTGVYNGVETDTLSISELTGKGGNLYRVKIWTGQCALVVSDSATLTVEGPISFVDPPDDITRCAEDGVTFEVTVVNQGAGGAPTIGWEVSTDGGLTWSALSDGGIYSGTNTTTLVISQIAGLNGYQYRAVASTGYCESIPSAPATVYVEGPISFTNQPDSTTVCADGTANFSVETANLGLGAISYQWQQNNGSTGWQNISDGTDFSGTKTGNLSVTNLLPKDGYTYRVIIQTTYCSSDTSDVALLTVEGPMSWTDQPDDVTQCSGSSTSFTVAASIANSGTISYQWQYSTDGLTWADLSDNATYSNTQTATLTVNDVAGLDGYLYRAVATSGVCSGFESDPARLTVEGPLSITSANQPDDVTACSDLGVVFAVKVDNAGQGQVFYQWEESPDNGTTWNTLFNQGRYNGVTTDTLSIDTVSNLYNYLYRVRAWTQSCSQIISDSAQVVVEGPLAITDEPNDTTVCSGSPTAFWIQFSNPGAGAGSEAIQWQVSTNGGVTWSDLSNSAPYSGATNDTLLISDVAGLYNYKYRCRVGTPNCSAVTSAPATLTVEGPIGFTQQPANVSVCSNRDTIFNSVTFNSGANAMNRQWQVSTDGGNTWADLSNGSDYGGVKTEDLTVRNTATKGGYQYRLVLTTSTCTVASNEVTLTVKNACTDGTCDFDLDGLDNNSDPDDDGDGLADVWEDYITNNSLAKVGVQHTMDNCNNDSDGDGITDDQEDPDGDGISNGEETDGDGVSDGDPLDPCDPVLSPACIGIVLDLKVFLQGAFMQTDGSGGITSDTLMRDDLRQKGLIPVKEPYTALGYEHKGDGGGEMVTDSAQVFGVTGPNAIVDWVFIEIRSSIDLDSVITTRSALLQRDGDIVDVDGVSPVTFPNTIAGPYFVAIRHRNHLGVMTVTAGQLSPIVQTFDFRDTSFVPHGTNAMFKSGNRYYMWAGDFNSDGKTIYQGPTNDLFSMLSTVLGDDDNTDLLPNYISQGYFTSDVDLDGQTIYQGPGTDRTKQLFGVVFSYPENGSILANYVILQQLP